tara:strand:- start:2289 stop:4133 length:1845 start_codon:yes stop_codon:yes gene_type:complete
MGLKQEESKLRVLNLQVEAREKTLGLENQMLAALTASGAAEGEIATQAEKVNKLTEQGNKIRHQSLELELSISDAMEDHADSAKITGVLWAGVLGSISKASEMIKLYSENTRNTADTMGVNVNEAKALNTEILGALTGAKGLDTNLKDVVSTQLALSEAYGGSMEFTAEQAVNLDIASKKLGISNTTAASFSQLMFSTGESSQEVQINMMAATKALSDASGVKFDVVMADIAQSGKEVAGYFGVSGKELAVMAVQARKMGFELSDMKDMSEGLLDVENRIEKQMKFNMLTGKNINLDKATALALEGDHEGMMREVVAQAGNLDDLGQLEIKALNEALGVDIMKLKNAGAIREQKEAQGIAAAEIAATEALIRDGQIAAFGLQLERDEAAATAEERKNNALDLANNLAAEAINKADDANNYALIMQGIQMVIQGVMVAQSIASMVTARNEKQKARATSSGLAASASEAGLKAATAISSLTANSAITFGIGTVIALAAAGVGIAAMYALMKKPAPSPKVSKAGDLAIDPAGGPIVMSPKEGGVFQGTKNDGLSMSPSHGKPDNSKGSSQSSTGMDIQPLLKKLDQLITAVHQGRVLNIDGYKLNEALHLAKTPSGV